MSDTTTGVVRFEDNGGNKIRFFCYEGLLMPIGPGDQVERMRQLPNFQAREDDVFVCGYPKTGTNWTFDIAYMILQGKPDYHTGNKMDVMMEFNDHEAFQKFGSPRCLSHHFRFKDIPSDVFRKRSKMIYLLRNPKDVCVSHFHHNKGLVGVYDYHGNWSDYIDLWLDGKVDYGDHFSYVKEWEKGIKDNPDVPIHVVRYENLITNFDTEARKLAKFLNRTLSDEFFEDISRKCDFKTMKKAKAKNCYSPDQKSAWRDGDIKFLRKGTWPLAKRSIATGIPYLKEKKT